MARASGAPGVCIWIDSSQKNPMCTSGTRCGKRGQLGRPGAESQGRPLMGRCGWLWTWTTGTRMHSSCLSSACISVKIRSRCCPRRLVRGAERRGPPYYLLRLDLEHRRPGRVRRFYLLLEDRGLSLDTSGPWPLRSVPSSPGRGSSEPNPRRPTRTHDGGMELPHPARTIRPTATAMGPLGLGRRVRTCAPVVLACTRPPLHGGSPVSIRGASAQTVAVCLCVPSAGARLSGGASPICLSLYLY